MSSDENDSFGSVVKAGANVISEVAKAEQEQHKTYQTALDLVRRAGTFLSGVFGPASEELGRLFGDQMKFWRFKNAVNILQKAQAIVEKRGLKPEQLNSLGIGEGVLVLDAASLEEDESVQELWARLMANAVDPEAATKTEKVYIDLLKSISGREAVLLDLLEQIEEQGRSFSTIKEIDAFGEAMNERAESKWRKFSEDERAVSIQNLARLRCLTARPTTIDLSNLFAQIPQERGQRNVVSFGFGGAQWAAVDPQKFQKVLEEVVERQMAASGMIDFKKHSHFVMPVGGSFFHGGGHKLDLPEANFMLTPLGKGLMRVCRIEVVRGVVQDDVLSAQV